MVDPLTDQVGPCASTGWASPSRREGLSGAFAGHSSHFPALLPVRTRGRSLHPCTGALLLWPLGQRFSNSLGAAGTSHWAGAAPPRLSGGARAARSPFDTGWAAGPAGPGLCARLLRASLLTPSNELAAPGRASGAPATRGWAGRVRSRRQHPRGRPLPQLPRAGGGAARGWEGCGGRRR